MKLKQFNHPVHCALCHGFIWYLILLILIFVDNQFLFFRGLHHQGFECLQCSLVTHKKCHQHIPFWCRKSLFPVCTVLILCRKKN
jgi:hypothetical protein